MFVLCKAMKWSHLPVAGGLYDQHPRFIEDMTYILQCEAEEEAKRQEAENRKAKSKRRS